MSNRTFGSDPQRRMAVISADLWPLVRHHPALCWNGRLVSMSAQVAPDPALMAERLIRLQGATSLHFLPMEEVDDLCARFAERGIETHPFHQAEGGEEARDAAEAVLGRGELPKDLSTRWIRADSPTDLIAGVGNLAVSCGVTPACELAMRGQGPPSAVLALTDPSGTVIACGMSFLGYPADSPHARTAFWGMVATCPSRRGEGLASHVGAALIARMWDQKGARQFITGVAFDNEASTRMCLGLGVRAAGRAFLGCTDPTVFGAGGITR